jgi:hypothetical protein
VTNRQDGNVRRQMDNTVRDERQAAVLNIYAFILFVRSHQFQSKT